MRFDISKDKQIIRELIGVRVEIVSIPQKDGWHWDEKVFIGEKGLIIDNPEDPDDLSALCLRMDNEGTLAEKLEFFDFPSEGCRFVCVDLKRLDDPNDNY